METCKYPYFRFTAVTDRKQKLENQWQKEREEAMEILSEQRGGSYCRPLSTGSGCQGAASRATHTTCGQSPAPGYTSPRDAVLPGEQLPYFSIAGSFHYPFSISQDTMTAVSPGVDSRVSCCTTSNGLTRRGPGRRAEPSQYMPPLTQLAGGDPSSSLCHTS